MQMTIENTYDNLKSSLDDLELMLHQMVRIDRARDVHELHDSIQNLLQSMGDYTKADRVFIFEFRDALHIYRNTYEWCAPGITPQIDNLQTIEPSDIPVWQAAFEQGENIVIPNLEDVRDTMPGEYEILRIQDIHSEISFPIFSKDALIGFLGLDNPTIEGSHRFINLLAVVGSHLGGAWPISVQAPCWSRASRICVTACRLCRRISRYWKLCAGTTPVYTRWIL